MHSQPRDDALAKKAEVIVIRVDADTKRRLELAAESRGLTLSTFVIRAAEAAARFAMKKQATAGAPSPPVPRTTSGACPAYFRAICWEASQGGDQGYMRAGRKLLRTAASEIAWESDDELTEKFNDLKRVLQRRNDDGVLAWFDREFPRCMALIPRRRRSTFLEGAYRQFKEDDKELML
jgi:hypothetical protein